MPAGPPLEEQTRAYPADAGASVNLPPDQPHSPFSAADPARSGAAAPAGGSPFQASQPGQPAAALASRGPGSAGGPGAQGEAPVAGPSTPHVTQYQHPSPESAWQRGGSAAPGAHSGPASASAQIVPGAEAPAPGAQAPAQTPWGQQGASTVVPEGPFSAHSAPGATSAPAAHSAPGAPSAPGTHGQATGYESYEAPGPQAPGAPGAGSHTAVSQVPASQHPQSAPQPWGSRSEGEMGMSSVFPVATARAEAERAQQGAAPQAAAQQGQQSPQASTASPWDAVASGPSVPQATPVVPAAHPAQPGSSQAEALPVRSGSEESGDESLASWLLATFLSVLPVVGILYLLVVAFTTGGSPARRTWARAMLLWAVIGTVLGIVSILVLGGGLLAVSTDQGA